MIMESHATILHDFDFVHEFTSDQMVEFLRGESVIEEPTTASYVVQTLHDELKITGHEFLGNIDTGIQSMIPAEIMEEPVVSSDANLFFHGDGDEREEEDEEDNSCGTAITAGRSTNADRSRTLVAERRRRGRMKEKLYALRALVPNITKMDKASIVGDAVTYVQDLQRQAKKLKAEIESFESSLRGSQPAFLTTVENQKARANSREYKKPILMKILQMEAFQVEEREFYVRVVSDKGDGVAVALYRALESLTCFHVQCSNFSTLPERLILTSTVNVTDCGEEMNLSTLKFWLMTALMNQGFEF